MNINNFTRRLNIFFITLPVITLLLTPTFTSASSSTPTDPGAQISLSNIDGLNFQLHTTPFQMDHMGNTTVEGLDQTIQEPGFPALPYYSTLIALPPQASVSVSVTEIALSQHHSIEVQPVPQRQLQAESDPDGILAANPETINELAPRFTKDEDLYSRDMPFPETLFEISEPFYLRDLRLVELKLFPIRYNPYRRSLTQAAELSVQLTFSGAELDNLNPSSGFVDDQAHSRRDSILNFDQSHAWRSLPQIVQAEQATADLPIDVDTYKIIVDQNGIYDIPATDLQLQGMTLPVTDISSIQMMHRGQPVAFQVIDLNFNGQFDEGDQIRFYGWAFDGSRYEQMYVNDNVFWLWLGATDSRTPIPTRTNEAGAGTVVTNFVDSVTRQDKLDNFSGWSVEWENEPTILHMGVISPTSPSTASDTYFIDLPDPDPSATNNSILVELTTQLGPFIYPSPIYTATTYLNNSATFGEQTWTGRKNFNLNEQFPASDFKQPLDTDYPANEIKIDISSNSYFGTTIQLTRINVLYTRLLSALGDQLIFSKQEAGQHEFQVTGFSSSEANSVLVWDISNPRLPEHIQLQAQNITAGADGYTYHIGRTHAEDARFIATSASNILAVKDILHYKPVSLNPAFGSAHWLAITHGSLRPAAETLATFRESEMSAWVVDIEDVTNQIGYGFHTPQTIRDFLTYAITTWTNGPPKYVTLFGDATRNPVLKGCSSCSAGGWNADTPTLIVTDFAFVDRWNGMVPSDFTMTLLFGDDLFADINIGRMPANTLEEANHMVDKVILFETGRRGTIEDWQKHFLFIADNDDSGGFFCDENEQTGTYIPTYSPDLGLSFTQEHLCLEPPTATNTEPLRMEMYDQIHNVGTQIINYRGHGAPLRWAGGPAILEAHETDFWQNDGRPVFILSADCLDGYFIYTHTSALGETFHRLDNRGSAAHWSSSGLGFSSEHSVLHTAFYKAVFDEDLTRIGDAIQFAKEEYILQNRYFSEVVSFILLGDPAMDLFPSTPTAVELPLSIQAFDGATTDMQRFSILFSFGVIISMLLLVIWKGKSMTISKRQNKPIYTSKVSNH